MPVDQTDHLDPFALAGRNGETSTANHASEAVAAAVEMAAPTPAPAGYQPRAFGVPLELSDVAELLANEPHLREPGCRLHTVEDEEHNFPGDPAKKGINFDDEIDLLNAILRDIRAETIGGLLWRLARATTGMEDLDLPESMVSDFRLVVEDARHLYMARGAGTHHVDTSGRGGKAPSSWSQHAELCARIDALTIEIDAHARHCVGLLAAERDKLCVARNFVLKRIRWEVNAGPAAPEPSALRQRAEALAAAYHPYALPAGEAGLIEAARRRAALDQEITALYREFTIDPDMEERDLLPTAGEAEMELWSVAMEIPPQSLAGVVAKLRLLLKGMGGDAPLEERALRQCIKVLEAAPARAAGPSKRSRK